MKSIKISGTLCVAASVASRIKDVGIILKLEDGKYVARIGDVIIPSRDADITIELNNVVTSLRSKNRGRK